MAEVRVTPTRAVRILSIDKRGIERLTWCAATSGMTRLFWIDGYLLCLEIYEKSFDYELTKGIFPICQLCYAEMPRYTQIYDLGRGTQLPIVDVSDLSVYQAILRAVREHEKSLGK